MHVVHRLLQQILRLGHGCIQTLAYFGGLLFQQLEIHTDGSQRLANFIMQLAADTPAFLFLSVQHLAG